MFNLSDCPVSSYWLQYKVYYLCPQCTRNPYVGKIWKSEGLCFNDLTRIWWWEGLPRRFLWSIEKIDWIISSPIYLLATTTRATNKAVAIVSDSFRLQWSLFKSPSNFVMKMVSCLKRLCSTKWSFSNKLFSKTDFWWNRSKAWMEIMYIIVQPGLTNSTRQRRQIQLAYDLFKQYYSII